MPRAGAVPSGPRLPRPSRLPPRVAAARPPCDDLLGRIRISRVEPARACPRGRTSPRIRRARGPLRRGTATRSRRRRRTRQVRPPRRRRSRLSPCPPSRRRRPGRVASRGTGSRRSRRPHPRVTGATTLQASAAAPHPRPCPARRSRPPCRTPPFPWRSARTREARQGISRSARLTAKSKMPRRSGTGAEACGFEARRSSGAACADRPVQACLSCRIALSTSDTSWMRAKSDAVPRLKCALVILLRYFSGSSPSWFSLRASSTR